MDRRAPSSSFHPSVVQSFCTNVVFPYPLRDEALPVSSPHGMGHKKVVHCYTGTGTSWLSVRTGRVAPRPPMTHAIDFPVGLHFFPIARIPRLHLIGIAILDLSR